MISTPMIFALVLTLSNAHEVTLGRYFEPKNCFTAMNAVLEASKYLNASDFDGLQCKKIKFEDVNYEGSR